MEKVARRNLERGEREEKHCGEVRGFVDHVSNVALANGVPQALS